MQLVVLDPMVTHLEMLVIPVCEGDADWYDHSGVSAIVKGALDLKEFTGDENDTVVFFNPEGMMVDQVMLVGVGQQAKLDRDAFRKMCGNSIKKCIAKEISSVVFALPNLSSGKIEPGDILGAMIEGASLGSYQFDAYKKPKHPSISDIRFWVKQTVANQYTGLLERIQTQCRGTCLAREWVNLPSNHKRPDQLVQLIKNQLTTEAIRVTVLEEDDLREKQFGALLAVGAGSDVGPKVLIMDYGTQNDQPATVLIGKGVTFDSGGINLKPSTSLEDMKMDMSGAAAVAATLITAARLNLPGRIIGAIPIVENMPSGSATRPGDIVRSYSGKTIEIGNTDAEGRLILADTISYMIEQYRPGVVIDIATLTGACVVGLGERIAGLFSNDISLSEDLIRSSQETGERCWPMPLPEDYKEYLKSEHADLSNMSSSKWGGAITASLFLSEFIQNVSWAHIDIAGPAWIKKESAFCGVGGTGFGVRLLIDFLERLEKKPINPQKN